MAVWYVCWPVKVTVLIAAFPRLIRITNFRNEGLAWGQEAWWWKDVSMENWRLCFLEERIPGKRWRRHSATSRNWVTCEAVRPTLSRFGGIRYQELHKKVYSPPRISARSRTSSPATAIHNVPRKPFKNANPSASILKAYMLVYFRNFRFPALPGQSFRCFFLSQLTSLPIMLKRKWEEDSMLPGRPAKKLEKSNTGHDGKLLLCSRLWRLC
jgi:hypothetical protein